jgi:GntR family transcriptional repressor for pyruvate dehydrogenase complex
MFTSSKLGDVAARTILDEIKRGRWQEGEMLPSQRDLAVQLGISRPPLREAISVLEALGILRSHPGKGVFVVSSELPDQSSGASANAVTAEAQAEHIFQLRLALEPFVVGLVAQSIDQDELAQLRLAVLDMREAVAAGDAEAAIEADIRFHQQLVHFSHNPVFAHVMQQTSEAINEARSIMREHPDRLDETLREHEAILTAIKARDSAAASRAMQQHILNAGERLKLDFVPANASPVFQRSGRE